MSKWDLPSSKRTCGWREWVALSDLGIRSIKAKVDTGARSSSLHAFESTLFKQDGIDWVRFAVHPMQRDDQRVIWCEAPVLDRRQVRSSNGDVSVRLVIRAELRMLDQSWPIELTLANRDAMGFRMLIGREAVRGRFLVDSGKSFYGGRPKRKERRR